MPAGKLKYFLLTSRIQALLWSRLADSACEVIAAGMLVKAGEDRLVAPDVSVVCGEPETEADTRLLLNPILVVEVTSPSSIDYGRGLKRDYYWGVASVQAYLLIDQHRALVELYTRGETGWRNQRFTELGDEIPLEALCCSLHLRDIYHRIEFEEGA